MKSIAQVFPRLRAHKKDGEIVLAIGTITHVEALELAGVANYPTCEEIKIRERQHKFPTEPLGTSVRALRLRTGVQQRNGQAQGARRGRTAGPSGEAAVDSQQAVNATARECDPISWESASPKGAAEQQLARFIRRHNPQAALIEGCNWNDVYGC
jgi:hypothetical protein